MAKIVLKNIEKKYGDVSVVRGIDAVFEDGHIIALLGSSGCGKTTTLRMIAGLESPSSGEIYIGDTLVDAPQQKIHIPPEKRQLGMVFQSYAVWPHRSVLDNVAYPLEVRGIDKRSRDEKAKGALSMVHMEHLAARMPAALSGGQQQRVALARALVHQPAVLLLDEPLSNLDARLREAMRDEIGVVARQVGATVVYVTHDQSEALALADKIAVMRAGKIEQFAAPDEVYQNPRTPFVASFVGTVSFLRVYGKLSNFSLANQVTTQTNPLHIPSIYVPDPTWREAIQKQEQHFFIGIRPEWCTPVSHETHEQNQNNSTANSTATIKGEVRKVIFLGSHYETTLHTEGGSLLLKIPTIYDKPSEGKTMTVQIHRALGYEKIDEN